MGKTIAMLHPGDMGSAVGACLVKAGNRVLWVGAGRSAATRERAAAAGLAETASVAQAVKEAAIVFSICPPHAALDVARDVAACGFKGVYVDANAVSPSTAREVDQIVSAAGASLVDGGIVGPPPGGSIPTRMCLSGTGVRDIAALFEGTLVTTVPLDGPAGAASALKVCYAAWTKGSATLLADVRALASAEGVDEALLAEWAVFRPQTIKDSELMAKHAYKAWRWVGEMEEIAASFEAVGLPGHYHHGAADICRRLEQFKDTPKQPDMAAVLAALKGAAK